MLDDDPDSFQSVVDQLSSQGGSSFGDGLPGNQIFNRPNRFFGPFFVFLLKRFRFHGDFFETPTKMGDFFRTERGDFRQKSRCCFWIQKNTHQLRGLFFGSPVGRQSSRGLSQHRGEEQTAIHGEEVGEKRGRIGWGGGCVIDKNGVGGRFL